MSLIKTANGHTPGFRSLLSNFFDNDYLLENSLFRKDGSPAVNVMENENNYEIDVAAPGLKKEDFKIEVENGILTISAERKTEHESKDNRFTRREFSYSSFSRSFALPENTDENAIEAKYNDGILKLTINKTQPEPSKKKVINLVS